MVLSVARERSDLSIFFDCLMVSTTMNDYSVIVPIIDVMVAFTNNR